MKACFACDILAAFEKDGPLTAEELEQRAIAKSKMLGNIKFVGTYVSYLRRMVELFS